MGVVAKVPGGAPAIARAAEAINELNGNAREAVLNRGVSPAAAHVVLKFGGPEKTLDILHALNSVSTKKRTVTGKRRKYFRVRTAELSRLMNQIKKRKLVYLYAHKVQGKDRASYKDLKLKKFYKQEVKKHILRNPRKFVSSQR
jgi:hypothetical protein